MNPTTSTEPLPVATEVLSARETYLIKGWASTLPVCTLPGVTADAMFSLCAEKSGFKLDPYVAENLADTHQYLKLHEGVQLRVVWPSRPAGDHPEIHRVWFESLAMALGTFMTPPSSDLAYLNGARLVLDFGTESRHTKRNSWSFSTPGNFFQEFARRYPRLTAHMVCHSLGYATPALAARIVYDGSRRQTTYCEWINACWKDSSYECLKVMVKDMVRHGHHGYMSDYGQAKAIVRDFIENGRQPMLASWF